MFTTHADGRITVDHWPERTQMSDRLLQDAMRSRVQRERDLVHFIMDNGAATYRLTDLNYAALIWDAELVEGWVR